MNTTTNLNLTKKQLTTLKPSTLKTHKKGLLHAYTNSNVLFAIDPTLDFITVIDLRTTTQIAADAAYSRTGVLIESSVADPSLSRLYTNAANSLSAEIVTLDKQTIANLVNSASTDQTRIHLNSAYFDIENKKVVSTDGYTMFLHDLEVKNACSNFLIPLAMLKKLKALNTSATFYCSPDSKYVKVLVDDSTITFYALKLERDFPRYQAIIPNKFTDYCTIDATTTNSLLTALKLDANSIAVFEGNTLQVQQKPTRQVIARFEISSGSTDIKKIGFARNILESVLTKNTSHVFRFTGEMSVCRVNDNFIAMPIRL